MRSMPVSDLAKKEAEMLLSDLHTWTYVFTFITHKHTIHVRDLWIHRFNTEHNYSLNSIYLNLISSTGLFFLNMNFATNPSLWFPHSGDESLRHPNVIADKTYTFDTSDLPCCLFLCISSAQNKTTHHHLFI